MIILVKTASVYSECIFLYLTGMIRQYMFSLISVLCEITIKLCIRHLFLNFLPKMMLKFVYSGKATKFCEISTLLLSYVVPVTSKVKISQNFVAFSEYMNFNKKLLSNWYSSMKKKKTL